MGILWLGVVDEDTYPEKLYMFYTSFSWHFSAIEN